ncbi:interferon alpha-inducible protein 27-like protein 2B [Turdus rufiventris]|nr:interferon alpha-inducible protein 27-like protein 2B [Turdus rufiventris]
MADQNVRNAGFTPSGITAGSLASSLMSEEARASGGGVPSGGPTSTLQELGEEEFAEECFAWGLFRLRGRCTYKSATGYHNLWYLNFIGARGTTHSSGYTSGGIWGGSRASETMSREATAHGGGVPRGGTTSTVQSIGLPFTPCVHKGPDSIPALASKRKETSPLSKDSSYKGRERSKV